MQFFSVKELPIDRGNYDSRPELSIAAALEWGCEQELAGCLQASQHGKLPLRAMARYAYAKAG